MSEEKRYNPERVRVAVCQREFSNATPQALEKELRKLPPDTDFFCTAEHSFMMAGSDPRKTEKVLKVAELAKKYDVNLILGGFMQAISKANYFCALFISRRGEIYCHQKKDKIRLKHMGTDDGVFPSEFGQIGILICVEIEDHIIREACLKYKPKLIFNPALIISRGEKPNFKNSSESISGKLEKYAVDYNLTIVRVDHGYPIGMSSTQIICPDHTYYFPCYTQSTMIYDINLNEKKNFQSVLSLKPPYTIRSYFVDNTGNRYRTHALNTIRVPVLEMQMYDPMMILVTRTTKQIECWNYNTLKVKTTLQRKGRIEFPQNPSLMISKKDNFISLIGDNQLTVWNGRNGTLVHDIEDLAEKGKFLNFMMNGMFVATNDGSPNKISFYEKTELKLTQSLQLGRPDGCSFDQYFHDPIGMAGHPSSIFTISKSGRLIQEWDVEKPEEAIFTYEAESEINKLRFFDNKLFFSDKKGNLFVRNEDRMECLVKEYEFGIRDFLVLRNTDKMIIIDEQKGAMKLIVGGGNDQYQDLYEFGQRCGIKNIIFDGKTKVFTRGDDFVRIAQFQRNRSNIYLGDLLQ